MLIKKIRGTIYMIMMYWCVNNIRVTDDVISCDNTKYPSHALPEVVYGNIRMIGSWLQDSRLVSGEITKIDKRIQLR